MSMVRVSKTTRVLGLGNRCLWLAIHTTCCPSPVVVRGGVQGTITLRLLLLLLLPPPNTITSLPSLVWVSNNIPRTLPLPAFTTSRGPGSSRMYRGRLWYGT
ncbi:hypothetical protein BDW74DRAFT_155380 [Aspergillus multicolor]|uniref:uncharacterized protein n=1 Tax=Aspergillus multicolor TaxID=41759 RepID=UPI003CCE491E